MQCFCLVSHSFIWICEHSPDLLPPAHPTFWSGKRFCNHRACWVPTILKHEPYRNLSLFGTNPLWQEWWFISRCQWSPHKRSPHYPHILLSTLLTYIFIIIFIFSHWHQTPRHSFLPHTTHTNPTTSAHTHTHTWFTLPNKTQISWFIPLPLLSACFPNSSISPNRRLKTNFSFQFIASYVWYSMENLAGD